MFGSGLLIRLGAHDRRHREPPPATLATGRTSMGPSLFAGVFAGVEWVGDVDIFRSNFSFL